MAGKKVGSDGQVRKTTAEWAADTATYPEGMRLMDTDTGTVRVSKGTTYAQAWVQSSGGGASAWGDITGTLSDQTDLQAYLETLANGIGAIVTQTITNGETTTSPSEDAVFDALAGKAKVVKLNGTAQPTAVIEVRTGTTDVNGEMSFDLSAYTSVMMIAPFIDRTPCDEVEVVDDTPATYTVAFRYATVGLDGAAQVTLLCTP